MNLIDKQACLADDGPEWPDVEDDPDFWNDDDWEIILKKIFEEDDWEDEL